MQCTLDRAAGLVAGEARARGDEAAFELIVRRHNQAMFRAARGVLDDADLAQEAVQEAYLNAFIHLGSFEERASLKTWLTRIAVNQAIDCKRRQRPTVSLDENVTYLHRHTFEREGMAPRTVDRSTPEIEAAGQEMRQLLEAVIQRLPEIYRCVFILRDVEGLSVADSAFCLDINEALVRKRLSRAREMLRESLLREMETGVSEVFGFAGKRCDAVTARVMARLQRRG